MAGKRMTAEERTNARPALQPGVTESFFRLIRLSLRRLLLSRACLCFTGPEKSALPASERHGNFKTRQTRLPGRGIQSSCAVTTETANPLEITTITRQNKTSRTSIRLVHQTVHLLVLTRPSVAGFNAPPDRACSAVLPGPAAGRRLRVLARSLWRSRSIHTGFHKGERIAGV